MKVNLKKASAIVENLTAQLNDIQFKDVVSVGQFENVEDQFKQVNDNLQHSKEWALSVIDVIYSIRRKIAEKNATLGVSDILNKIAETNRKISVYQNFAYADKVGLSVDVLQKRVELMTVQPQNGSSVQFNSISGQKVTSYVHTKESIDVACEQLIEFNRVIVNAKDELLGINVTNHVTLSDVELEVVKKYGLI